MNMSCHHTSHTSIYLFIGVLKTSKEQFLGFYFYVTHFSYAKLYDTQFFCLFSIPFRFVKYEEIDLENKKKKKNQIQTRDIKKSGVKIQ